MLTMRVLFTQESKFLSNPSAKHIPTFAARASAPASDGYPPKDRDTG
jgi:hypothetical protein